MRAGKHIEVESYVKPFRLRCGLSQLQLAGLARTTGRTIRSMEQGRIMCTSSGILIRVAAVLGVGVADMFPVFGRVGGVRMPPELPSGVERADIALSPERDGAREQERARIGLKRVARSAEIV